METTRRLMIAIGQDAAERLADLARAERRDPREQASLLLERALARLSRQTIHRQASGGSQCPLPPPPSVPTEPATP